MSKMRPDQEAEREELENGLAALASARARLELVHLRISQAAQFSGMSDLLAPAEEDLRTVHRLIGQGTKPLARIWRERWAGK